jgi:UDP-2,3-diacylglucosamine pyrophosphatase LpxH
MPFACGVRPGFLLSLAMKEGCLLVGFLAPAIFAGYSSTVDQVFTWLGDSNTMSNTTFDTLLISDLHLGSELSRAGEALELLQSLRCQRLILLGDIFADLNFGRLTKQHWKFLSYIRKLSNPKRGVEVVWVEGNHDEGLSDVMSHLVGVPVYRRYVWEYAGLRHLAIHGHQFDRFVSNNYLISRLGQFLHREIQKIDGRTKAFSRFLDRLNTRWLRLSEKVARGAVAYAQQGRVQRVFCGHTHVAAHVERGGIDYYNTGCWVDARPTYVTVDAEGVRIHEYATRIDYESGTDDRHSGQERGSQPAAVAGFLEQAGLSAFAGYESLRC